MIVNLLSPVYVVPRCVGYWGAATLSAPTDYTLFPGEVDGQGLLADMGARDFSRGMQRGIIVPKGCQPFHAKIVLYGTVYCYTCGWLT